MQFSLRMTLYALRTDRTCFHQPHVLPSTARAIHQPHVLPSTARASISCPIRKKTAAEAHFKAPVLHEEATVKKP